MIQTQPDGQNGESWKLAICHQDEERTSDAAVGSDLEANFPVSIRTDFPGLYLYYNSDLHDALGKAVCAKCALKSDTATGSSFLFSQSSSPPFPTPVFSLLPLPFPFQMPSEEKILWAESSPQHFKTSFLPSRKVSLSPWETTRS